MPGRAGDIVLRPATDDDVPELETLIAASARGLGQGFYGQDEIEAAVAHVFGIDRTLVGDGTYYVAEGPGGLAGCGGWSARRTMFGADRYSARDDAPIDPLVDPARIRAFFVAPDQARRGIASDLLDLCERAASTAGFTSAALMATLPGVPFYQARGYRTEQVVVLDLDGVAVRFVAMTKPLLPIGNAPIASATLTGAS